MTKTHPSRDVSDDSKIAFIVNDVWGPTETFIKRQVEDLSPGRTVVVARGSWFQGETRFPIIVLNSQKAIIRFIRRGLRRLHVVPVDPERNQLGRFERRKVKAFLEKYNVCAILSHFMDSSLRFLPLAREMEIPFFVHAHGYDVSRRLREQYWKDRYKEYNHAAGVVVPSNSIKQRLVALGMSDDKVHVIPYGVDVAAGPTDHPPCVPVRFLAVGRMTGKKAPLVTLEAFRLVNDASPQARLDFVGEGPLLDFAVKFIGDHKLKERVILHGYQRPSVINVLRSGADIFVQHSIKDPETGDEEGLPVAILEAMSYALPVVSTRHAGIPEAVVDGVTGYLVREGDASAMAERMLQLIESYPLRRALGVAGWQRAKDYFTWEREREALWRILMSG